MSGKEGEQLFHEVYFGITLIDRLKNLSLITMSSMASYVS